MPEILENVYRTETNLASGLFNDARNATNTNVIPRTGFNQKILNNTVLIISFFQDVHS